VGFVYLAKELIARAELEIRLIPVNPTNSSGKSAINALLPFQLGRSSAK
jgi:hypothetical protein